MYGLSLGGSSNGRTADTAPSDEPQNTQPTASKAETPKTGRCELFGGSRRKTPMSTGSSQRPKRSQKLHPKHVNAVRRKGGSIAYYFHPYRGTWREGKPRRLPDDPQTAEFWEAYQEFVTEYEFEQVPYDRREYREPDLKPSLIGARQRSLARAAEKGLPHDLAMHDVFAMFWKQKRRCAVSGLPFSFERTDGTPFSRAFAPSIDRIDNSKGYTLDNVRLVVRIANFAMGVWGEEAFLVLAKATAEKHGASFPAPSAVEVR